MSECLGMCFVCVCVCLCLSVLPLCLVWGKLGCCFDVTVNLGGGEGGGGGG